MSYDIKEEMLRLMHEDADPQHIIDNLHGMELVSKNAYNAPTNMDCPAFADDENWYIFNFWWADFVVFPKDSYTYEKAVEEVANPESELYNG